MSTQYSKVGPTSLGDWYDVVAAVRVMGVNLFASYFRFVPGADEFFVTYNGNLVSGTDKNYFVSYFDGTAAPVDYGVRAAPLTDGANAIVLGSFRHNLPVLGKIRVIISQLGTLIFTSLY